MIWNKQKLIENVSLTSSGINDNNREYVKTQILMINITCSTCNTSSSIIAKSVRTPKIAFAIYEKNLRIYHERKCGIY